MRPGTLLLSVGMLIAPLMLASKAASAGSSPTPPKPGGGTPGGGGNPGGGNGGGGTIPGGGGGGNLTGGRAILARDVPNWSAQPEGKPVPSDWTGRVWWTRDANIFRWLKEGLISVPAWTSVDLVRGSDVLRLTVSSDLAMLGGDVRVRGSILTAQAIADSFGCLLPTCGIVDAIESVAEARIPASPKAATDKDWQSVDAWLKHEDRINALLAKLPHYSPGQLVASTCKTYVMHPALSENAPPWGLSKKPDAGTMYGWFDAQGNAIQSPVSGASFAHEATYFDYSHGCRLVQRTCELNGVSMDLADVYQTRPDLVMRGIGGFPVPVRHPLAGPALPVAGVFV